MKRTILKNSFTFLSIYCTAWYFTDNFFSFGVVHGRSMQPTFNFDSTNTLIITDKITKRFRRGDIITFISPTDENSYAVKRITATEGEIVKNSKDEYVVIPKGHIWVEGDNRLVSLDSNSYGPISLGLVHSRVLYSIYPKVQKFIRYNTKEF